MSAPFRKNEKQLPAFFFVTDPKRTPDPISIARKLPKGSGILFRHFGLENRFEVGLKLSKISKARELKLFVSYDTKLAEYTKADGMHWPKSKVFLKKRSQFKNYMHSSSAHTHRQIRTALQNDFDACFVSSVFESQSSSAPTAMGVTKFRLMCQNSAIPIYGLGGITSNNAAKITKHAGIAAVSGFKF